MPQGFFVDNANTQKTNFCAFLGLRAGWDFEIGLSVFAEGRNLAESATSSMLRSRRSPP
ncbi:hypothetical protein [Roseomonas harenae]|uniref:hypothetical protein n=1 Tax=Muricoccus harenae TaxID=2692566 RepID=UPI001331525D|nr:hypothetical protein [Roseomonas harenae]